VSPLALPVSPAGGVVPGPTPAERLAAALGERLRRDVAWVALLCGLTVAAAAGDPVAGVPQALVAAALLLLGARAEVLKIGALGRATTLVLCGAVSWALAPEPRELLAGFLGLVTATTLLQPKGPRELGLVLATGLLQTALAAVLSVHPLALLVGPLFVLLSHGALGTFHRLRAARRVAAAGGVVVRPATERETASSARVAAAAVLAVALPIFVVLPRAQIPFLSLTPSGSLTVQALGDEMRLGGARPFRDGGEPLGTLAPLDAAARSREPYLRVEAFDVLEDDGARWSASRDSGEPLERDLTRFTAADSRPFGEPAAFDVDFHGGVSLSIPVPEGVRALEFREPLPERVRATGGGALRLAPRKSVARLLFTAEAGPLDAHAGFLPVVRGRERERLLEVPAALRADLRPIVAEATAGKATARERAFALEAFIRSRCAYSLEGSPGRSSRPIVDFLTRTRSGHCEWFAASLATTLRVAGIPARVVSGFYPSRWNELGSRFWVVRRRDAHAWVEAHVDGAWVRLDATPVAGRAPDPYEGVLGFLARVRDAVAFEWNRRVLGFDREAQRRSFESVAASLAGAWSGAGRAGAPVVALGLGATAALVLALRRLRARRGRPRARSSVAFYERVLAALRRRGVERRPEETAAAFARRAGPCLSEEARVAVVEATRAFEDVRYGGSQPPVPERASAWRSALLARRGRRPRPGWTPGGS
jgi:transglutaminase-like putative cysteine protease